MNGLDLYNFMYDQFVWPKYPFASRDVRPKFAEREPKAAGRGIGPRPSVSAEPTGEQPSRSVIVLADRRRKRGSA